MFRVNIFVYCNLGGKGELLFSDAPFFKKRPAKKNLPHPLPCKFGFFMIEVGLQNRGKFAFEYNNFT